MKNTMEYKGYIGSVEFSKADGIFLGKVIKAPLCENSSSPFQWIDNSP